MSQIIALLAIVAMVAGGALFQHRISRGRMWSPLWIAFSTTTGAILFLVSGISGDVLDHHDRFVTGKSWSDVVSWTQIDLGFALLIVAAYFWRKGLRSLKTQ